MSDFLFFYQSLPSKVDPIIFSIGSFGLRWYSLGYILTFICFIFLARYRIRHNELNFKFNYDDLEKLALLLLLGAILGGRIGYVLFYDIGYYIAHPLEAILPFRFNNGITFVGISGLSYHGGFIGLIIFVYLFARKKGIPFIKLLDLVASVFPLGYTFGRLGNFMNGELYGRETTAPWGMYFLDHSGIPFEFLRHPSQLYEAFGEGILLFVIVWSIRNIVSTGILTGVYVVGYGAIRFIIEFFRQPDAIFKNPGDDLGTVISFFTMGQVLSFLMIVAGSIIIIRFKYYTKNTKKHV